MNKSMYMKVLTVVAACLYYSGLVRLGRWLIQQQGPQLIILNYHAATPGDLRQHLLYLQRHYRILHLEDALDELFTPSPHKVQDKRTLLAITFDDGYYDNYTHAFALADELHVPITLFLIPSYLETSDRFWWQEPNYLVTHAKVDEITIEAQIYHLNKAAERTALIKAIDTRIRFAPSVDEREAFLREVHQLLAVPPQTPNPEEKSSLPFSWAEVEIMKRSEWVSFGGHTMHHPLLAYLTDPSEVEYEVYASRTELERHLQSPVRSFAYPVGNFGDFGERGVHSVQKAGYSWAVTTIRGINTPASNPYLLHRFTADPQKHWLLLAARISGVGKRFSNTWNLFSNLVRTPIRLLSSYQK